MNFAEIASRKKREQRMLTGKCSTADIIIRVRISDDELTPLQLLKQKQNDQRC